MKIKLKKDTLKLRNFDLLNIFVCSECSEEKINKRLFFAVKFVNTGGRDEVYFSDYWRIRNMTNIDWHDGSSFLAGRSDILQQWVSDSGFQPETDDGTF